MSVEIFAFGVGMAVLVVLVVASMSGGWSRRRREGDGGPIIPVGRLGDDNDDVGLN